MWRQLTSNHLSLQKHGKELDTFCGKDGSQLVAMKAEAFIKKFTTVFTEIKEQQPKEPGNLKEYSPWMTNFKPEFFINELEIPGQYLSPPVFHRTQSMFMIMITGLCCHLQVNRHWSEKKQGSLSRHHPS